MLHSKTKTGVFFVKHSCFFSFTKMRVSEKEVVLSDCFREFPCLYDKRTPEYHQRDDTGNCWKEVAKIAGLENGKIPFVFFQTLFLHHKMTRNYRTNTIAML